MIDDLLFTYIITNAIPLHKAERYKTQVIDGGDRLDYHIDHSAPTVGLLNANSDIFSNAREGSTYYISDIKCQDY